MIAAVDRNQIRRYSDQNDGGIDSSQCCAERDEQDAVALSRKRVWKSRAQGLRLLFRNQTLQPERQQPGKSADESCDAPPGAAQIRKNEAGERGGVGIEAAEVVEKGAESGLKASGSGDNSIDGVGESAENESDVCQEIIPGYETPGGEAAKDDPGDRDEVRVNPERSQCAANRNQESAKRLSENIHNRALSRVECSYGSRARFRGDYSIGK